MDLCANCIRFRTFEVVRCENCGEMTILPILQGKCMIYSCKNCKYTLVGSSFYSPCERDNEKYSIKICKKMIINTHIVKLCKLTSLRALTIYRNIVSENSLEKQFTLKEVMIIVQYLEDQGIEYTITPNNLYSKYFGCLVKEL